MSLARPLRSILIIAMVFFAMTIAATSARAEEARFLEAQKLFSAGDYKKSVEILQVLCAEQPNRALYWFNLGASALAGENPQTAIKAFRAVISLKSPLSRFAALYLARSEAAAGGVEAAWQTLTRISDHDLPSNLSLEVDNERSVLSAKILATAQTNYEDRDYLSAQKRLNLLSARPLEPDAELLLGLVLLRLNDRDRAEKILQNVAKQSRDSDIATWAGQLLAASGPQQGWQEHASMAFGYDSNIYQLPPGSSPVGSTIGVFDASAFGALATGESASLAARFQPQWIESFGHADNRYLRATVELEGATRLSEHWTLEVAPNFKYEYLGSLPLLLSPGAVLSLNHADKNRSLRASVAYNRNLAGSDTYSYLAGYSLLSILSAGFVTDEQDWFIDLRGGYRVENNQDYQTSSAYYPLSYSAPTVGWRIAFLPSSAWTLAQTGTIEWRYYDKLAQPENLPRYDIYLDAGLRLSYFVSRTWELFLAGDQIYNSSNLGPSTSLDRNFTEAREIVGSSWEFQ